MEHKPSCERCENYIYSDFIWAEGMEDEIPIYECDKGYDITGINYYNDTPKECVYYKEKKPYGA